ncbi:hypothetical protein QR680_010235 [Steinernema hermaphroditum]|uniref:Uncharacterized protein n=1 Tax=Steinernema hermaphroditum TaxID=289476 RepID=A0AA39MAV7_9BILA|nr:hypothetical protein QR680_010235 [Steinernema hermaphroditum]
MPALYHPEYQCCCGSMHITVGALAIVLLALVSDVIFFFWGFIETTDYAIFIVLSFATTAFGIIASAIALYGLKKERAKLLVPFMISQISTIIEFVAIGIVSIVGLFSPVFWVNHFEGHFELELDPAVPEQRLLLQLTLFFLVVVCAVGVIVGLWFLQVVYKCYCYLSARRGETVAFPLV